ncbi:MAG: cation transporter [Deltaproteobacteria bacterium]|nr:cation transporter [Deltaproteobacteria bacterium]
MRHSEHGHDDEHAHDRGHAHDHDLDHDHDRAHGYAHGHARRDEHDHEDAHGHDHGRGGQHHDVRALGRRALGAALVVNGAFFIVEGAIGWWTGSLALLSDAVHMLTDVLGLVVAVAAASARLRPPDGMATFGHGRFAVLGGFFNAVLGLLAAAVIVVEAVGRLRAPPPVPGLPVIITAALGLVVNLASAWGLHRSGDRGVNMRGALVHMLGDALGSVAAMVAGAVLIAGGPAAVDAVISVLVAALVAGSAVPLLRDAVHILLERAPRRLDPQRVRALLLAHPAVADVAGLHAWELDDGETFATFVLGARDGDLARLGVAADELRATLRPLGIVHAIIEWRPPGGAGCCPPSAMSHPPP